MKLISYTGYFHQLVYAEYGIAVRDDGWSQRIDIVAVNSKKAGHGTSLWLTQEGRDQLLNKILDTELKGVRVDFVRFFVLIDAGEPHTVKGMEYPISVDLDDFIAKGNPVQIRRVAGSSLWGLLKYCVGFGDQTSTYYSRDVVAGCAAFSTSNENCRLLDPKELQAVCLSVGYQRHSGKLPTWMAPILVGSHPT